MSIFVKYRFKEKQKFGKAGSKRKYLIFKISQHYKTNTRTASFAGSKNKKFSGEENF